MNSKLIAASTLLLACSLVSARVNKYLSIGDPAPDLKAATWIKGVHTPSFEPGKVYVVEFWATWCGPCKANIPHLTELAKKYAGKVSVTGVDVFESTDPTDSSYLKKVAKFVKDEGAQMEYNVAADNPKGDIAKTWVTAAGEHGIPVSFIIGKDGKISWIGYPLELGSVLDQVLADKFDVENARLKREEQVSVVRPIEEAMGSQKYAEALKLIDAAVAKKPELAHRYAYEREVALVYTDFPAATANASAILKESDGDIGAYRMIASIFASQPGLPVSSYKYGRGIVADALKKNEMTYMFVAMDAAICDHMGDKPNAIKSGKQAIALGEKDPHCPPEFVTFLKKNLAKYEAKK